MREATTQGERMTTHVLLPELTRYGDYGLLALRCMVAGEFFPSGLADVRDPTARAKRNDLSVPFTLFIGVAEMVGSIALVLGILTQLAALGLIVLMLGAIQKKIFVWHTGYWGKDGYGWHYDLMLLTMNIVIVLTAGGRFVLL